MREGSVRIMDGKIDITDAVLAKVKVPKTEALPAFLHERLGYTESRLKEIFGEGLLFTPKPQ